MPINEPVAIFWDYENCAPQSNAVCHEIIQKIRDIGLKFGTVKSIKAYARLSDLSSSRACSTRSDFQAGGVSFIDCPHNGRKDVADKMMLVDMMQFGMDNPAPGTVVLISGERDFAYGVSAMRNRHYRVVIMAPLHILHDSLRCQASALYDWDAVNSGKHGPGRSADFGRPPLPLGQPSHGHIRPPSGPQLQKTSAGLPTPVTTTGTPDNNGNRSAADGPPRDLLAGVSALFTSPTTSRSRSGFHSHESSGVSEAYHDGRTYVTPKGKERWGSVGSSISPSTFVTALTPTDPTLNVPSGSHSKENTQQAQVFTEEPMCEDSSELDPLVRRRASIRSRQHGDPSYDPAATQRVVSTMPAPVSPRPTSSPVLRPQTAGPVMVTTRVASPSSDSSDDSAGLEMSTQTLPANVIMCSPHAKKQTTPVVPAVSARRDVPTIFIPLVQAINSLCAEKQTDQPLRSNVAIKVSRLHPSVYRDAGVDKFKQYTDLAVRANIVRLGGTEGSAWIQLLPDWQGL